MWLVTQFAHTSRIPVISTWPSMDITQNVIIENIRPFSENKYISPFSGNRNLGVTLINHYKLGIGCQKSLSLSPVYYFKGHSSVFVMSL